MHVLLNRSLFYSRIHLNLVFRKDNWSIVHVSVSLLVHRTSLLFQCYHISNYSDLLYSIYTLPFHVQMYMYMFIVYLMLIDDAWFGHTWATFLSFERRSQIRWEKRQKQKVPNDENVITHFQFLIPLNIIWEVKFVYICILHGKLLALSLHFEVSSWFGLIFQTSHPWGNHFPSSSPVSVQRVSRLWICLIKGQYIYI